MEPHLKILYTVAETVSRTLDVEAVLRTALEALTHVTGHEIASLHLLSTDGTALELRGHRGLSPRLRDVNRSLPVGQGLIGGAAALVVVVVVAPGLEPPGRQLAGATVTPAPDPPARPIRVGFVVHVMQVAGAEVLVRETIRRLGPAIVPTVFCLDAVGPIGEELVARGVDLICLNRRPGWDWNVSRRLASASR